jgi:hypothetical protein
MSNRQESAGQSLSFVGLPRSRPGLWSISLAFAFVVLFVLWWLYVGRWRPMPRPTFFSDPLHACLLLGAAAASIAGAFAGVLALVAKRERSILIVVSIVLGAFVLLLTIAQIINPTP